MRLDGGPRNKTGGVDVLIGVGHLMERLRAGRNKLEAEQRLASGKHHTRLGEHLFDLGLQLGFPFVSWHARRLSMAA